METEDLRVAPEDWAWHLFPRTEPGSEAISLEAVARLGLERVRRCQVTGDRTPVGPVLHWAHLLKVEQASDGDWPALVDGRTGEALDQRRTTLPAELLSALGDLLDSTEFDAAVERARRSPS